MCSYTKNTNDIFFMQISDFCRYYQQPTNNTPEFALRIGSRPKDLQLLLCYYIPLTRWGAMRTHWGASPESQSSYPFEKFCVTVNPLRNRNNYFRIRVNLFRKRVNNVRLLRNDIRKRVNLFQYKVKHNQNIIKSFSVQSTRTRIKSQTLH